MQIRNKLLLTGKRELCALETVDPRLSGLESALPWKYSKVKVLVDIQDEIFKLTTNFDACSLVLEGEQWVTENIPGQSMTTGFESIDIVLDYVDKGVAITALADKLGISMGSGDGFWG